MKIAVLSANGKSGSLVVKEALARGDEVSAFVRQNKQNVPNGAKIITKDIFNIESSDLAGFDVVVDAFGEWVNLSLHLKHIQHLAQVFSHLSHTRLIVIGGAGSLYVDKEHKTRLLDLPTFPKEYLGVAQATADALDFLRKQDFNWTYVSPPADYVADGARSGKYTIGGEELFTNSKGESKGSYADLALAVVDMAHTNTHNKQRVSIVSEI
ncbi:NAD(P)-dependent oxidoreductase [Helicobacter jaachi]|uniref:NAD(P)-dependent oxidoreductase n=1 Tax=Helicobacter jaachi TaxID=1677920 RepID=A0A4U8TE38_9HELI|nr:NAD(P)H-binding protein [Helicobacter jaachi]TLD97588.1 NAD(P)-dependent oxidoreductase [Helicobacter jaachi]